MTPLALEIWNDWFLPPAHKKYELCYKGYENAETFFKDAPLTSLCFECSSIYSQAKRIVDNFDPNDESCSFLPNDVTWIEFQTERGFRVAILVLQEDIDIPQFSLAVYVQCHSWVLRPDECYGFFDGYAKRKTPQEFFDSKQPAPSEYHLSFDPKKLVFVLLSLINTPQVVGRVVRNTNPSSEIVAARRERRRGKFPLKAWTEIVLKPQTIIDKQGPLTSRISSPRCLHYVRSHYRPSIQRVVQGYWRGDKALGVKLSDYRVEPPSAA